MEGKIEFYNTVVRCVYVCLEKGEEYNKKQ